MREGNWIAIDKNLSKHFPDREFSKIDAAFSLTLDYDNNRLVTVAGYSKLWGWSRSKVRNFLDDMGVEIVYPEDTGKKQKQKGQIRRQIRDRSETERGQIRMVDTKASQAEEDRSETDQRQKEDRSKNTTNKPSNNTNTKTKKRYPEDSNEFRVAIYLLKNIKKRKPDFKEPNLQSWAKQADLILNNDKRDLEEVKKVINWCQKDEFWQNNILSVAKLRAQYDQLVLKMSSNQNKKQADISEGAKKLLEEISGG